MIVILSSFWVFSSQHSSLVAPPSERKVKPVCGLKCRFTCNGSPARVTKAKQSQLWDACYDRDIAIFAIKHHSSFRTTGATITVRFAFCHFTLPALEVLPSPRHSCQLDGVPLVADSCPGHAHSLAIDRCPKRGQLLLSQRESRTE